MTYACPTREYAADSRLLKLQRLQKQKPFTFGNQVHTSPQIAHGFQNSLCT
jgi:hypothetical protein